MQPNWLLIFAVSFIESFLLAFALTAVARRAALRWGVLDHPGERKVHEAPTPLLGGAAIYFSFTLVVAVNLVLLRNSGYLGFDWVEQNVLSFLGDGATRALFGVFLGSLLVFALGILDDLNELTPERKLIGQIGVALVTVLAGIRLDLFIENALGAIPFLASLPAGTLSFLTSAVSIGATMFWLVLMINAMNFLDNMDGLCGGVCVISAISFFVCVYARQEYFVCVLLAVFAGSVAGFLPYNLNPAKIFMGDAGSMFAGYLLGTAAVLGTFYSADGMSRVAVAAPLLALCVPLFDILGVVAIRLRHRESIMKGDKRHFSHRLVDLGMTQKQAVKFIWLVAAIAGFGGTLLSRVGTLGTIVILAQTAGVFLLIVLLMQASRNPDKGAP